MSQYKNCRKLTVTPDASGVPSFGKHWSKTRVPLINLLDLGPKLRTERAARRRRARFGMPPAFASSLRPPPRSPSRSPHLTLPRPLNEGTLRSTRTTNLVDEYKLHETLGSSAAFQVRRATRRASGEQCAIKLLHLSDALVTPRGDPAVELLSEIEILSALQGAPGVVSLLDHLRQIEPPVMAAVFELFVGGDLFDRIEMHGPCTEPEAAQIAQQVGGALAHMHLLRIVHRDIKPDNLAFASRGDEIEVKLIDFGFAIVCPQAKLRGLSGTMDYAAPELVSWYAESQEAGVQSPLGVGAVEGTPYDEVSQSSPPPYTLRFTFSDASRSPSPLTPHPSPQSSPSPHSPAPTLPPPSPCAPFHPHLSSLHQAVDLWSFGVTLYIALCAFPPFFAEGDDDVVGLIQRGAFSFSEEMDGSDTSWAGVSADAKQLIASLLTVAPEDRLNAPGLLDSDWVRRGPTLTLTLTLTPTLNPTLTLNPTPTPTPTLILNPNPHPNQVRRGGRENSDVEAARRVAWIQHHLKLGNFDEATELGWDGGP